MTILNTISYHHHRHHIIHYSHSHNSYRDHNIKPASNLRLSVLPCYTSKSLSSNNQLIFHGKHHISPGATTVSAMASGSVTDALTPALDSSSEPPAIFDGTPKLYISYTCPYAQRVWIARNYKGLQDKIKLVPIDLKNRPAWYKEKVYSGDKVPALEHNNQVMGESLDLLRYIDDNFEGPSLLPQDFAKREFAEELLAYTASFYKDVTSSFKMEGTNEAGAAFDKIETALSKFDDGPCFLGQFSLVDIAYAPFIERFKPFLMEVKNYDITIGRPRLARWMEEMNKMEAYTQTRRDPKELVDSYKKRFLVSSL